MGSMIYINLEDELEFIYGKSLPAIKRVKGEIPVYGSNGIVDYHNESCFDGPGIIIGRKGTIGAIELSKSNFWSIDTTYKVNMIRENDCLEYWFYFLQTLGLNKMNTHSAVPGLNRNSVYALKISVFQDISERKAIAHILSTLDEKIEVNNQINKTLENIAQTIFKHWFVDFEFPNGAGEPYKSSGGEMVESELGMIPKGWEVCRLGDTFNVIDNRGKTPPRTELETKYPIIDVKALAGEDRILNYNNCMKYVDENTYNNWFRSGHPLDGDILLSTVGSLAEMKIFLGDIGCIAQNVVALRVNDFSNLYLYQYLKYIKDELVSYNIGSVQPSIKITHIIKHKILKPNKNILDNFHHFASDITNQIYNLNLQNQRLKELRDSLLPKLMSGEIRVPIEEN